ncbi:MAG: NADH-quinone oxidoreductase subunit A [Calditrichia bacterium]
MLIQYLPVLILLIIAVVFGLGLLAATHLVSPRIKNPIKQTVYESGLPPQMDARKRFPVRFYVVAMMFILFDVEVIFLYPWAVVYKQFMTAGSFIFWEMILFLGILFAGYIYLWKRGAFIWE